MEPLFDIYAWTRVGLGAVAIVAPGPVAAAFGLGDGEHIRVAARMLGGRDLFMALGMILATRHGASPRGWIEAAVAVDIVDGLATVDGVRNGALEPRKAVQLGAIILGSIAVGGYLISQVPRRKELSAG
jgi:hypothetical protein